jgi:hypothetical protein
MPRWDDGCKQAKKKKAFLLYVVRRRKVLNYSKALLCFALTGQFCKMRQNCSQNIKRVGEKCVKPGGEDQEAMFQVV